MEDDFDGLCVCGQDDEFCDASVDTLGGLVRALSQLSVVLGLLDDIEDCV